MSMLANGHGTVTSDNGTQSLMPMSPDTHTGPAPAAHNRLKQLNSYERRRHSGSVNMPPSLQIPKEDQPRVSHNQRTQGQESYSGSSAPNSPQTNNPAGNKLHFRQRAGSVLGNIKEMIGGSRNRDRSESAGAATNSDSDVYRALVKVRARRAHEKLTITHTPENGMSFADPSYVPYDEDDDTFNEFDDAFRPRSFSNDLMIVRKTSRPMTVEVLGNLRVGMNPYSEYLRALTCYDMAPTTGQIIMLDVTLSIEKGFAALLQEPERVGLLYDCTEHDYMSLITQTDFLRMLYYAQQTQDTKMHEHRLSWWTDLLSKQHPPKYDYLQRRKQRVIISSDETIDEAVGLMCEHKIQRMPVYEKSTGTVLYFLGLKKIVHCLHNQIRRGPIPTWMLTSAKRARIGTWDNIHYVNPSTCLLSAVQLMLSKGLSTLPVLKDGRLLNVLTKSDIVFFALRSLVAEDIVCHNEDNVEVQLDHSLMDYTSEHMIDCLQQTVGQALQARALSPFHSAHNSAAAFCRPEDSIVTIVDKLVLSQCRCVYILDNDTGNALAAVAYSDMARYMVIVPRDIDTLPARARPQACRSLTID